jgi:nicotinamidase-related amidase
VNPPSSPTSLTLEQSDTALVLIDLQVRLAEAMPKPQLERALRNCVALTEMAARMKLPVAVSEQYPQGLGSTVPVLKEPLGKILPPARWFSKLNFSAAEEPLFAQFLGSHGRRTLIVAGMETHICVYQTVRGLCERGYRVHVPIDACLSRSDDNWRVGVDLCARAGAVPTSTEALLFDLVKRAEGEDFRALSKLIK